MIFEIFTVAKLKALKERYQKNGNLTPNFENSQLLFDKKLSTNIYGG